MNRRDIGGSIVIAVALASSIAVWQLRRVEPQPEFVGPPRADYTLDDYELVALDHSGRASFRAWGPLLVRDPYNHELSLEQPRFRISDDRGGYWLSRADSGWVDSKGQQLRLRGNVLVDGHEADDRRHLRLETEMLRLFPHTRTAATDRPVTIVRPNSILRGIGLEADLANRQLRVLSEVTLHHVPSPR